MIFLKKIRSHLKAIWVAFCMFLKLFEINLIAKIRKLFERIKLRYFFRSLLSTTGQVQSPLDWKTVRSIRSFLLKLR